MYLCANISTLFNKKGYNKPLIESRTCRKPSMQAGGWQRTFYLWKSATVGFHSAAFFAAEALYISAGPLQHAAGPL